MNILRNIFIALLALVVLAVAVGFVLPSTVHVQRSIEIAAPPATVFDILNSYKRYNEWSPWYEYDPAAIYTYSGPEAGVGARLEWVSSKAEVGSGSQEIVASEPPRRVACHLDFGEQGMAEAHYDIDASGEGSRVTWAFETDFGNNILERYFGLVLDPLVGPDFERGLAKLKTLAESEAAKVPSVPAQPTVEEVGAQELASIEGTTSLDPASVARSLDESFARVNSFLATHGLKQSGASRAITRFYDESGWGFEAAVPFSGTPDARARALAAASNGIKMGVSYAGSAVKGVHVGPHDTLPETYQKLEDFAAENGLDSNGRPWEQYVSDPRRTPQEELRTEVYLPVRKDS